MAIYDNSSKLNKKIINYEASDLRFYTDGVTLNSTSGTYINKSGNMAVIHVPIVVSKNITTGNLFRLPFKAFTCILRIHNANHPYDMRNDVSIWTEGSNGVNLYGSLPAGSYYIDGTVPTE